MLKSELRKIYKEKRLALSEDKVNFLSGQILKKFDEKFQISEHEKIHLFLSMYKFKEIDTQLFIGYFFERKVRLFVPKMIGKSLISIELTSETVLEENSWGICEPVSSIDSGIKDFDYVITPLLYCDSKGNRVGYGKGFYDHFFAEINKSAKKIGVNYFPPNETIDDVESTDIPLDYLLTPTEALSFGNGASNFLK